MTFNQPLAGKHIAFRPGTLYIRQIPKILLAYDMDYHTNDAVAMNRQYAIEVARAEGFDVVPLEWTQRYKGIDDVLLALLRREDAVIWTPGE